MSWDFFWTILSGQEYLVGAIVLLLVFGFTLKVVIRMAKKAPATQTATISPPRLTKQQAASVSGDNVDEWLRLGNDAMRSFRWDEAVIYLTKVLEVQPDNASLWFRLGRISAQKKDTPKAKAAFDQALALKPHMVEAHYEIARLHQNQNKLRDAIGSLEACLAIKNNYEPALKLLVQLLQAQEQYDKAETVIEKLATMHPQNPDYVFQGVACFEAQEDWDGAIQFLMAHQARFTDPVPDLDVKLARLHLANSDPSVSIKILESLHSKVTNGELTILNETSESIAASLAEAHTAQGELGEEAQNLSLAVEAYEKALSLNPEQPGLNLLLAKSYIALGHNNRALTSLENAMHIEGRNSDLYYLLGKAYDNQNQYKVAMQHYQHCIEIEPSHVEANYAMGTLCGMSQDLNGAVKFLLRVVQLAPEFIDGYYNLAVAYEQLDQKTKALGLYKKVLSLDPSHAEARGNLKYLQSKR